MKKILFIVFAVLFLGMGQASAQHYKYLFTENPNGVRYQNAEIKRWFDQSSNPINLRFSNGNQYVHFEHTANVFSCQYDGTSDGIIRYKGPLYNTDGNGYAIGQNAAINAVVNMIFCTGTNNRQVINVYFNTDYSRMNIKLNSSEAVHVFERAAKTDDHPTRLL